MNLSNFRVKVSNFFFDKFEILESSNTPEFILMILFSYRVVVALPVLLLAMFVELFKK